MKNAWSIAFGVVCAFLGSGLLLLIASPPRGIPLQLLDAPTQTPLLVHVTGAVLHPGVVSLSSGSRVRDALAAAGGFLSTADKQALNLAAPVHDGERIDVPLLPVDPTPGKRDPGLNQLSEISPLPTHPILEPGGRINLNTASQADLESLPEIGPVTAAKIIAYREENGPFKSIEEIINVKGIGPATFEQIRDFITVAQ